MLSGAPARSVFSPQGKLLAVQPGAVTEQVISRVIDNYLGP
jgi:hypothetical protein